MRRLYMLLMLAMLAFDSIMAQSLIVNSVKSSPLDISATKYERRDLNGDPCGLVKVQLGAMGAQFEGNVVGEVEYKTGEYWVYMSKGSKQLRIKHPNFLPLTLVFQNYDISGIQSKVTYEVMLVIPQIGQEIDDGMRYLVMTVNPPNAIVYIDGKLQKVTNGAVSNRLSVGTHRYRVEAVGYASQEGTVQLTTGKKSLPITLSSVQANLKVVCPTSGAQIFINDELRGTTPWQGQLTAGDYMVEARLKSHRNQRQTIKLNESENRTVNLPALIPITSSVDVNYQPLDTEVLLDGKLLGNSPDIFRGILIGQHEMEFRKAGYQSKKVTINIEEGKSATVTGSLSPVQKTVADNSSTYSSSNTNSSSSSLVYAGSPTNPTIQYLFTHPMLYLDGNDISLSRSQMESKLGRLHGSGWRMQINDKITYLRPNGSAPMIDGREIEYMYCYYSNSQSYMKSFQIDINDSKFSSYQDAKRWTDNLVSQIRAMGFSLEEEFRNEDYHYTGANGYIKYEVRLPQKYYNQLYIDIWFQTDNAISSLNSSTSSTSLASSSSSLSEMTLEHLLLHPAATLSSNTTGNYNRDFNEIKSKHPSWTVEKKDGDIKIDVNGDKGKYLFDSGMSMKVDYSSDGTIISAYNYYFDGLSKSMLVQELNRLGLTVKEETSTRITYNRWKNLKRVFIDFKNSWVWLRVWVD